MAYKAVVESRREAEGKFSILEEALRLYEERTKNASSRAEGEKDNVARLYKEGLAE
ncbi:hypothetical protein [Mesorhizobium sp.]|uniref:hypothetical protein n=1 Tax=Mesorhizobium sp. TaxID=1871066 RepID=UPI00257B5A6D|nr:hypothetical protein [Mesorhizobium sp.]